MLSALEHDPMAVWKYIEVAQFAMKTFAKENVNLFLKAVDSDTELKIIAASSPQISQMLKEMESDSTAGLKYIAIPGVIEFISAVWSKGFAAVMPTEVHTEKAPMPEPTSMSTDQAEQIAKWFIKTVHSDPELRKDADSSPQISQMLKELESDPMAGWKYIGQPEVAEFTTNAWATGAADAFLQTVEQDPELQKEARSSPLTSQMLKELEHDPMAGLKFMGSPEVSEFMNKVFAKELREGVPSKMPTGNAPATSGVYLPPASQMPAPMPIGEPPSPAMPAATSIGIKQAHAIAMVFIKKVNADPDLKKEANSSPQVLQMLKELESDPMAGWKFMGQPEVFDFMTKACAKMAAEWYIATVNSNADLRREADSSADISKMMQELEHDPRAALKDIDNQEVCKFTKKVWMQGLLMSDALIFTEQAWAMAKWFVKTINSTPELKKEADSSPYISQMLGAVEADPMSALTYMVHPEVSVFAINTWMKGLAHWYLKTVNTYPELGKAAASSPLISQMLNDLVQNPMAAMKYVDNLEATQFTLSVLMKWYWGEGPGEAPAPTSTKSPAAPDTATKIEEMEEQIHEMQKTITDVSDKVDKINKVEQKPAHTEAGSPLPLRLSAV
eukprot:gnl/TRDRNA2_/TRDRNA2_152380_c0_seq1.p1 gnl/TRDRNA2_/TRDRNA2_152380_c0~~gnl/TRDRNA2_/TRDRNA2_152380_c0_seq1.p1  ORF type:complete len:676 (+),score=162.70 gnl/TRDRNA2_/TRDRNA2_152380_c0_seq1:183-2030(+)